MGFKQRQIGDDITKKITMIPADCGLGRDLQLAIEAGLPSERARGEPCLILTQRDRLGVIVMRRMQHAMSRVAC